MSIISNINLEPDVDLSYLDSSLSKLTGSYKHDKICHQPPKVVNLIENISELNALIEETRVRVTNANASFWINMSDVIVKTEIKPKSDIYHKLGIDNTINQSTKPQLGNKMNQILIDPSLIADLKDLAGRGTQDEFVEFKGIPPELLDALKEQQTAERKGKYAQLASNLLTIQRAAAQKRAQLVEQIRRTRAEEKRIQAELNKIGQAVDLANGETKNYLPLLGLLNTNATMYLTNEDLVIPSTTKVPAKKTASIKLR